MLHNNRMAPTVPLTDKLIALVMTPALLALAFAAPLVAYNLIGAIMEPTSVAESIKDFTQAIMALLTFLAGIVGTVWFVRNGGRPLV